MKINPAANPRSMAIWLSLLIPLMCSSQLFAQDGGDESDRLRDLQQQLREARDAKLRLERENQRLKARPAPAEPLPTRSPRVVVPGQSLTADRLLLPGKNANSPFATTVDRNGLAVLGTSPSRFMNKKEREVQSKIGSLIRKIKESDDDKEKEDSKAELKKQLEQQYDSYLSNLEAPLKKMEERLAKLRSEFEKRKEARDELVKLRLENIWYQANGMGWPGDSGEMRRYSDSPFGTAIWTIENQNQQNWNLLRRTNIAPKPPRPDSEPEAAEPFRRAK